MKTVYIDTNVVFSKYKPTDPYNNEAIKILQSNRMNKISSTLNSSRTNIYY